MKKFSSSFVAVLSLMLMMSACTPKSVVQVKTSNTPAPEWTKNSIIYEVNVRQFTPEGTFKAFETHLPRLKEMGVDILWLMPIHPIGEKNRKGGLGSYYSISDYKAVNPEFGTMDDFKQLVGNAHALGMKVIIDWVANHTAWDHAWTVDNPDFYAKDSTGNMFGPFDWSDVAQLDYSNINLRTAMTDALTFWVREANIDGYRCDVAGMVPVDFWEAARIELDKIKPVFMLAEDEEKPQLLNNAFNANYGWSFHHYMNKVAKGEEQPSIIVNWFAAADTIYPKGAYPMQFTSNHDENSWNGTEYERMGDAVKTFAVLSFTVPGMPLIYTGQEAGLNKRLAFFEKDNIDWTNLEMADFYKKLAQLKKGNAALANGAWGGDLKAISTNMPAQVIAFERSLNNNSVVAIFNLSPNAVNVSLNKAFDGEYLNYFEGVKMAIPQNEITMLPWAYYVYVK